MTEDKMKGLFGGGEAGADRGMDRETARQERREQRREQRRAARRRSPDDVARAQDFINRYTTGHPSEGFTSDEAINYLRELREEASPEDLRRAAAATMNNLPEDQRKAFNEMLERRRAGTGMVTIDRTGDARAAEGRAPGQPGGMGMDDVLGGLFGGLLGGGMAMPDQRGGDTHGNMPTQNPLDDLFGGLFGGGDDRTRDSRQREPQHQQPGGVDEILNNPLGKAVLGGLAAFALKGLIDRQNQR